MMPRAQRGTYSERAERFERGMRPLLPGLLAASMRLTRNRSEAEDLVQETVLRAWRFFDQFESGSNLRAWMQRILLHTFVNRYRRARRERELMGQVHTLREVLAAAGGDAQEPEIVRAALSDGLEHGLSNLSPDLKAVLWAVAVDDLSYRETADRLRCPIGTVMSRMHRARTALRSALQGPKPGLECA
jgi:RNA polymerase sigma-70 factor (ECF subfamily)